MLIVVVYFLLIFSSFYILSMVEDSYFFQRYISKTIQQEEVISLSKEVIKLIEESFKVDNPKIDHLNENWTKPITIPLPNGSIDITIVDQERFLNLNYITDKNYLDTFQRLYRMLDIDLYLLDNLIDWIDKDNTGKAEFYEDKEYPVKNNLLDSIEELLLIKGYTKDILYGSNEEFSEYPPLIEFLTTYSNGKININTAPKFVLIALGFDYYEVGIILEERANKPFKSLDDFINRLEIPSSKIKKLKKILDVKSENFLVKAEIKIYDERYNLVFLLSRDKKGLTLIWKKLY